MTETGVPQEAPPREHRVADDHGAPADRAIRKFRFWRHFMEMAVAMVVGMAVMGLPFRAILGALGYTWDEALTRLPEMVCLVMTFNMAVGMVAWMRFRGHGWRASLEMTAAMYAATALALGMFWLHVISRQPLIGLMHALMVPAMLVAMVFRRQEHAHDHHTPSVGRADRETERTWKEWDR